MKELTDSAALNDAVYEMNFNGGYPCVKLAVGTVSDKEPGGMMPEEDYYQFTPPTPEEEILFEQALSEDGKVNVYRAVKKEEEPQKRCCCHSNLEKGESKIVTGRKVLAHGPVWVWAAIAIGLPEEGSEAPYLVVQAADTYGSENTTESEIIGYLNGKQREITARVVRRAHLRQLKLGSIRVEYKYIFVEPEEVGKAKVKEG